MRIYYAKKITFFPTAQLVPRKKKFAENVWAYINLVTKCKENKLLYQQLKIKKETLCHLYLFSILKKEDKTLIVFCSQ